MSPILEPLDNPLVVATSATKAEIAAAEAIERWKQNELIRTVSEDIANQTQSSSIYNGAAFLATQDKPNSTQSSAIEYTGTPVPINYKFNLPPHTWSLPLRPKEIDPEFVGSSTVYTNDSFHGYRRGRIWYWQTSADVSKTASDNSSAASGAEKLLLDRNYGFQFLWNPDAISVNVSRNMDITPNSADTLRVVAGVFPGQETVSLTIVLDRTNDFAYAKATGTGSAEYYTAGWPLAAPQDFNTQLATLLEQGTMADLEYLFRAINGSGSGDKQWTTLLGKKTANVGYLQPTLMGVALGPDTHNNLSYVGWISNLSMNHSAFTETMIPLRTTVTISLECFSGSGITAG
jgi:hypothetical protein